MWRNITSCRRKIRYIKLRGRLHVAGQSAWRRYWHSRQEIMWKDKKSPVYVGLENTSQQPIEIVPDCSAFERLALTPTVSTFWASQKGLREKDSSTCTNNFLCWHGNHVQESCMASCPSLVVTSTVHIGGADRSAKEKLRNLRQA